MTMSMQCGSWLVACAWRAWFGSARSRAWAVGRLNELMGLERQGAGPVATARSVAAACCRGLPWRSTGNPPNTAVRTTFSPHSVQLASPSARFADRVPHLFGGFY